MLKTKKQLVSFVAVFIAIELVLGIMVQITTGNLNTAVSFAVVVLACLFAILSFSNTKEYYLTQIALVCTVMADLFLVVIEPMHRELAMAFFLVTQIAYFLRIYFNQLDKKKRLYHLIIRGVLVAMAMILTVVVLREKTDFLSLISLFYYANLIMNVVYSFAQIKLSILFPIGLTMFALCDMFIGFGVLADIYLEIEKGTPWYWLAHPGFNLAWVFYVPSQALISLSLFEPELKTNKKPTV